MKVSVIVATYGSKEWKLQGADTAKNVTDPAYHEVIALHLPNGSLAEARNTGASAATGEWLCFLDADDSLDGFYLSAMAEAIIGQREWHPYNEGEAPEFSDPAGRLYVPSMAFTHPEGRCEFVGIPAWDRNIFDVNCAVIGTLVSRGLFEQVGGFSEWEAYEDWELWLRCIIAGAKLVPVPEAVYCARAEDGTGRNTYRDHMATYRNIRALHGMVGNDVWLSAKVA